MLMSTTKPTQRGFTLIELMVGLTVGLLVLAAVAAMYLTTARGGGEAVKATRLNQEIRSAAGIIADEIRRAGYCPNSVAGCAAANAAGTPTLAILEANNACILFFYVRNTTQAINVAANFGGFRLRNGSIEMRTGLPGVPLPVPFTPNVLNVTNVDCNAGTWEALTDPATVNVTQLTFHTMATATVPGVAGTSQCVTTANPPVVYTPGNSAQQACDNPTIPANTPRTELRQIIFGITAQDSSDANARIRVTDSIRVRNDRIFTVTAP